MQGIPGRDRAVAAKAPDGAAGAAVAEGFAGSAAPSAGLGVGVRGMEIATSLGFMAAGGLAIWDSARLGAGWGGDGPQSGYFPFWIGVLLVLAAVGNLISVARARRDPAGEAPMFLTWEQGRTVLTVLVPTAVYVAAIPLIGIYVASAALVAWFMARLGGFSLLRAVPAGLATAVVAFVVFEIWFLVALPKGPIEDFLGY